MVVKKATRKINARFRGELKQLRSEMIGIAKIHDPDLRMNKCRDWKDRFLRLLLEANEYSGVDLKPPKDELSLYLDFSGLDIVFRHFVPKSVGSWVDTTYIPKVNRAPVS